MQKFNIKPIRSRPVVSTASLPDIVFILLFFFMVVAAMRNHQIPLQIRTPEATELQKLEHRSMVNHIYVGTPLKRIIHGNAPRIQINDAFVSVGQLEQAIKQTSENNRRMTTSLKVDKEVTMGIVTDVKVALRKAVRLKVNYAAVAKAAIEY